MIKFILKTAMIVSVSFLTACASLNSSYDCPNQAGVMCKSLDQINSMVDSGQIPCRNQPVVTSHCKKCSSKKIEQIQFQPYNLTTDYQPGTPLRYGETVQRIWVSPFEDTEGNYHQDSMVYAIVKEGHWIGSPVKSAIS